MKKISVAYWAIVFDWVYNQHFCIGERRRVWAGAVMVVDIIGGGSQLWEWIWWSLCGGYGYGYDNHYGHSNYGFISVRRFTLHYPIGYPYYPPTVITVPGNTARSTFSSLLGRGAINILPVTGITAITPKAIILILRNVLSAGNKLIRYHPHLVKEFIHVTFFLVFSVTVILAISGCASLPNGPSVMVLPGTGMPSNGFVTTMLSVSIRFFQIGGTTANQAAAKSGSPVL